MKQSAKNGHQHHHHLFVNEGEGFDSALTESVCTTWRELAAQTSATQATDFIVLHQLTQRPAAQHRATDCGATGQPKKIDPLYNAARRRRQI